QEAAQIRLRGGDPEEAAGRHRVPPAAGPDGGGNRLRVHQALPEPQPGDEVTRALAAGHHCLGAGVDRDPTDLLAADLAPRAVAAVDDVHIEVGPAGQELVCRGQAGDAATDDDHARTHAPT